MHVAYGWIGDAELSSLSYKTFKFMYACVLLCLYVHMSRGSLELMLMLGMNLCPEDWHILLPVQLSA